MATLTIRNLPDKVRDKLRVRAAKRGVSMEAEARAVLADAASTPPDRGADLSAIAELQDWVAASRKKIRGERNDSKTLIRDRRREAILEVIREGRRPKSVFGARFKDILTEAEWSENDVEALERRPQ
jgi:plasmid stability protein